MPGCAARISIAARSPSSVLSGGIWTSTIATSGLCAATLRTQVGRVGGLGDDLEARVAQQPHDPLAQQRLVLGDDDAGHGGPSSSTSCGEASSALETNPRAPLRSTTSPIAAASSVDTSTTAGAVKPLGRGQRRRRRAG